MGRGQRGRCANKGSGAAQRVRSYTKMNSCKKKKNERLFMQFCECVHVCVCVTVAVSLCVANANVQSHLWLLVL